MDLKRPVWDQMLVCCPPASGWLFPLPFSIFPSWKGGIISGFAELSIRCPGWQVTMW